MNKRIVFKGCATALVTPFTEENTVDFEELRKLIDFQILEGVDALVICGTTGESATLSLEEKKEILKFAVQINRKRVPIIAGTGGNNTKASTELSKYAEKIGVDALLLVTPYYNKTTQEGLVCHFTEIAESTNLPIILYNVPSRTGINIEPQTCFTLSQIENIVGIKEASGNISQVADIASLCKDNFAIYSGNDDQIIPVLSLGGLGVISVLSNLYPRYVHHIVSDYLSGNIEKSVKAQLDANELNHLLFCEVNPIPIKYAMNSIGFQCGKPRLPLVELSEKYREKLICAVKELGN